MGVDTSTLALRIAREFYETHLPGARVTFVRAGGEALPFAAERSDLVNCCLALPYMRNARAIAEVARLLRPGRIFFVKIHHARYYALELWRGLTTVDLPSVIHGARVLAAGTVYHVVGRQPWVWLLNRSTARRTR